MLQSLEPLFSFSPKVNNTVTVTASGRVVKKRFNLLDDDPEQEVVSSSWIIKDVELARGRSCFRCGGCNH